MTIGIDPVAKGHRETYLNFKPHPYIVNIVLQYLLAEASHTGHLIYFFNKKAVGFAAHGFLGNQLFNNASDDLKTMGRWP
jgi:hypothetical protein